MILFLLLSLIASCSNQQSTTFSKTNEKSPFVKQIRNSVKIYMIQPSVSGSSLDTPEVVNLFDKPQLTLTIDSMQVRDTSSTNNSCDRLRVMTNDLIPTLSQLMTFFLDPKQGENLPLSYEKILEKKAEFTGAECQLIRLIHRTLIPLHLNLEFFKTCCERSDFFIKLDERIARVLERTGLTQITVESKRVKLVNSLKKKLTFYTELRFQWLLHLTKTYFKSNRAEAKRSFLQENLRKQYNELSPLFHSFEGLELLIKFKQQTEQAKRIRLKEQKNCTIVQLDKFIKTVGDELLELFLDLKLTPQYLLEPCTSSDSEITSGFLFVIEVLLRDRLLNLTSDNTILHLSQVSKPFLVRPSKQGFESVGSFLTMEQAEKLFTKGLFEYSLERGTSLNPLSTVTLQQINQHYKVITLPAVFENFFASSQLSDLAEFSPYFSPHSTATRGQLYHYFLRKMPEEEVFLLIDKIMQTLTHSFSEPLSFCLPSFTQNFTRELLTHEVKSTIENQQESKTPRQRLIAYVKSQYREKINQNPLLNWLIIELTGQESLETLLIQLIYIKKLLFVEWMISVEAIRESMENTFLEVTKSESNLATSRQFRVMGYFYNQQVLIPYFQLYQKNAKQKALDSNLLAQLKQLTRCSLSVAATLRTKIHGNISRLVFSEKIKILTTRARVLQRLISNKTTAP